MLKKILSIGTNMSPKASNHTMIKFIRLYDLLPIAQFPVKEDLVIDEINHYLNMYDKSYPGYLLLKFFDNKISKEYLTCCEENGIHPVTHQGIYKFKKSPTTIFSSEYWMRAIHYNITESDRVRTVPMSESELEVVNKYTDNLDISVGELVKKITFYRMIHPNYPSTDDIIENITGPIPRPEWPTLYVSILRGRIDENTANNILKYDKTLRSLMDKAISTLTEREQKVLSMSLKDHMRLNEIANQFDITSGRTQQILAKTYRKLRHPSRSAEICYILDLPEDTSNDSVFCIAQYVADVEKKTAVVKIIDTLTNRPLRLICENKFIQMMFFVSPAECFKKIKDYGIQNPGDESTTVLPELVRLDTPGLDTPLEDINLSVRSYNCLRRWGEAKTVRDAINVMHTKGLMQIRTLGKASAQEIVDKLVSLGFSELLPEDPFNGDDTE